MSEDADDTVVPADHGELRLLCWNRDVSVAIPARHAYLIYERNWRHVDPAAMSEAERTLVASLARRFGNGVPPS